MNIKYPVKLVLITFFMFFVASNTSNAAIPTVSISAQPSAIENGATSSFTWTSTNASSCVASSGWSGNQPLSGTFVTPPLFFPTLYKLTCSGPDGSTTQSVNINVTPLTDNVGSKIGINLSFINSGNRDLTFVDVVKIAKGFASLNAPWDPINYPAPTDANGWPTTDFGIFFVTSSNDPLNRPISTTFPSMFGTYKLSFTGQATVRGYNCCQIQNKVYNAATNTTIADVVVGPSDPYVALTFTNTNNGIQNLQLLRPGYPVGTTQVFTTEFLNAIAPFSTLRFMEPLQTNINHGSTWDARKLKTDPIQNDNRGIAWEYVIDIANATHKDIWINIPDQIDLNDTTTNNYIIQLATLIKGSLNNGIHVYIEYSNETWKDTSLNNPNIIAAIADVNSGEDTTLNYDNNNNKWRWGYRRAAHQTLKISQLFAQVFGPAAINTIIRPVYMSQYDGSYGMEDVLRYLQVNFGAPNNYLYGIGGAPYFSTSQTSLTDASSLLSALQVGLNQITPGAAPLPAYNGGVVYTGITHKSLANYYGLKTLMYGGGPNLINQQNRALIEQAVSTPEMATMIRSELTNFLSCDNDLFVYYKLSAPAGDNSAVGIYQDAALPTEKSRMFMDLAATPLSNLPTCSVSGSTPPLPIVSISATPSSIDYGATASLTWTSTNASSCVASSGWSGNQSLSGTFVTPSLFTSTLYTLSCTGAGGTTTQSVNINIVPLTGKVGSKLGINLSFINNWGNRDLTFVDVMKIAQGFALPNAPWDPINYPAPTDANGWPTTDFGIFFVTGSNDPLNRPLSTTFPSMFGTYKLSFTGQATVRGYNCCQIQNKVYNAATNTTIADVVVGPSDPYVALTFTNTNNGIQNLQLLRPGYPVGTTQVFTTEFLNAIAPFSTLRFMEPLQTNINHGSTWDARKLKTDPIQNDNRGIAWEYVIDIANATHKDIWINIPDQIDLNDTTTNNYIIQLATLIKGSLNNGIHVYIEYSNETWKDTSLNNPNIIAAIADVNSGEDTTLNYDNNNNKWRWGYRRAAHQTLKISQLFAQVFGPAAINTIIRPVYMSQYDGSYGMEDVLRYLQVNFGAPNNYLYGIGGAPYFSTSQTSLTDASSLLSALQVGLNQITPGAAPLPAYNGGVVYTGITHKSLANYYGLKTLMYGGGPNLINQQNRALIEQAVSTPEMATMIRSELTNFLSCDNDLFVYYKLSAPAGDNSAVGIYQDAALPTEKSRMFMDLAATPLSNLPTCSVSGSGTTPTQTTTTVVTTQPLPIVSISATPSSIDNGATAALTWTSTNASACVASSGWSGNQALSGAFVTPPLTTSTLYTLSCTGVSGTTTQSVNIQVAPPPPPVVSISATPSSIDNGATASLTWTSTNASSCTASSGWSGSQSLSGTFTTPPLSYPTLYKLTCTGLGGSTTQAVNINVTPSIGTAGSKLGINLSSLNDWADRDLTFVDVMKIARGFATVAVPWDPANHPAPTDANGWPTTDFGIVFISYPNDPLNRPLSATFPSMIGTYKLSFTGQATVSGYNCCKIQNKIYNAATNTTTADVVVGPSEPYVALTFTNTNNGIQNLQLLRPGYPIGTTQVFTTEFLNSIAPFSTLRFMEPLATNGNHGSIWNARKLKSDPTQNDNRGIAWEYVIDIANATNKDIWINIPDQIDLDDPTTNNYVIQLATLIKNSLHNGIHVYVEYSNETWNGMFPQTEPNIVAAEAEVSSGIDTTLNYDNTNNRWYWGFRRTAHQTLKISQLFAQVFGPAAINTVIRPVYMSQYVQPFIMEDVLRYLDTNFGAPNNYLYGIGGAPYFSTSQTSFTDASSLLSALQVGLNHITLGAAPLPAYNGGLAYAGITNKNIANYYGLKTLMYEGGPDFSNQPNKTLVEQTAATPEMAAMVKSELTQFLSCGNDLFVYYKLTAPAGDVSPWGVYEDVDLPTEKSKMFIDLTTTPLSSLPPCN